MQQVIRRNKIASATILVCIGLILISAWAWWHYIYSNPQRVFQRMLSTSLSTPSITKTTTDPSSNQSLTQTAQLSVNPQPAVRSVNTLQQADSTVKTESIATPLANYVRYNSIETSQKNQQGQPIDFSGVLGIWAVSTNEDLGSENTQLFSQAVLGVVPVAQLPAEQRQQLLAQITNENVYDVDYDTVVRTITNGRPTYTYNVGLQPRAYVNMLKSFSKYLGPDELKDVDVSQYPEGPLVNITISIDVWSSQLTGIGYTDSARSESYSAHGALVRIPLPTDAISREELQAKLQQIR